MNNSESLIIIHQIKSTPYTVFSYKQECVVANKFCIYRKCISSCRNDENFIITNY